MAERSLDQKPVVTQTKKRPTSSRKAETPRRDESSRPAKSATGSTKTHADDLLAMEEQYKRLNAELEARTAGVVRQADQLMREQSGTLSKSFFSVLLCEEDNIRPKSQLDAGGKEAVTKKKATTTLQSMCFGQPRKEPQGKTGVLKETHLDDLAEKSVDGFLAKTIQSMEEKMNNTIMPETVEDDLPDVGPGIANAQIRVLKAKLRIIQEELDQLTGEYYKKDEENATLCSKIKELEEERTRLQKSTNIQQTQIEKHRALAEDSTKKCDALQLQVSALQKDIENLNRTQKQAAAVHSTVEVRLNRALEEVERLKTQLNKMKLMNKDKISEEHQSKENLLAENKMLKKQKAELIMGFRKQLKLIDILKRQKMHFEAAKLLSFTEEEFMKALDWGKS